MRIETQRQSYSSWKWQNYAVATKISSSSKLVLSKHGTRTTASKLSAFIEKWLELKVSRFEPPWLSVTSGAPYWKSTINFSQNLRRQVKWKLPYRPCARAATRTRWWRTSPSAWLPAWLQWWSLRAFTFNSVHLLFCILISLPTDYQPRNTEKW